MKTAQEWVKNWDGKRTNRCATAKREADRVACGEFGEAHHSSSVFIKLSVVCLAY